MPTQLYFVLDMGYRLDNPATNEFLRELYRIGFDIRWSFNEATMGAIPEQNTAQNVNIETQYIEVPIESPDTDQGYYYYISAKNDAGREIWNYTSNIQEMIGDYYWVYPIGENGDHFLFCDEEIVCMDKYSGQVLWNCERNNLGGPFCFDEDDNLFTSRGIGFGITMISPDGRILKNTDDYSYDVSIWFVDEMHIEKEKLYVEGSGTTIVLDLTDMTAEYE